MHRFKFRLTCRAKDALFMHRAIMSSMDQVLLLCPRPLISLYVSIWASPLDLWYPRPRFRAWTGTGREAGSWQQDAVETGITSVYCEPMGGYGDNYPATVTLEGNVSLHDTGYADSIIVYMADIGTPVAHRRYYINQRQAQETRPANIAQPSIIYLGIPA